MRHGAVNEFKQRVAILEANGVKLVNLTGLPGRLPGRGKQQFLGLLQIEGPPSIGIDPELRLGVRQGELELGFKRQLFRGDRSRTRLPAPDFRRLKGEPGANKQ